MLGLEIWKDMGVKLLRIEGDSDLVVSKVKNKFVCKSEILRRYRNAIWDTMEFFDALGIVAIPREINSKDDSLVVVFSTLMSYEDCVRMEIIFRPSVPDNMDNWQVF